MVSHEKPEGILVWKPQEKLQDGLLEGLKTHTHTHVLSLTTLERPPFPWNKPQIPASNF